MKTGVSTAPCGVVNLPARAEPDVASVRKENPVTGRGQVMSIASPYE